MLGKRALHQPAPRRNFTFGKRNKDHKAKNVVVEMTTFAFAASEAEQPFQSKFLWWRWYALPCSVAAARKRGGIERIFHWGSLLALFLLLPFSPSAVSPSAVSPSLSLYVCSSLSLSLSLCLSLTGLSLVSLDLPLLGFCSEGRSTMKASKD